MLLKTESVVSATTTDPVILQGPEEGPLSSDQSPKATELGECDSPIRRFLLVEPSSCSKLLEAANSMGASLRAPSVNFLQEVLVIGVKGSHEVDLGVEGLVRYVVQPMTTRIKSGDPAIGTLVQ